MQSLETVPIVELEEYLYSEYTAKQHEERASERRIDLVKHLLQKLPESERIVMTLHYLAGSSCKEISEFLGVSLNTVKSRLHRARQRLQKEDHMVRETLGSFQPSTTLTENIIRTLKETGAQIDPATPSGSKPIMPWVIATSTLILVALMLGLGAQHLARFQQPYNLDATSEMTVDIVDAAVMMNLPSDPDVRNQIGNVDAPDKSEGANQSPNAKFSSSASGRVVDEAKKPVDDVKIAIFPVKDGRGAWFPIAIGNPTSIHGGLLAFPAEINRDGNFTIRDFNQSAVLLGTLPFYRPEARIIKVRIGELYLFPNKMGGSNGIVLETEQGEDITNVEITVRDPLQNRAKAQQKSATHGSSPHYIAQRGTGNFTGRVVDPDGNPVADLPIFIGPHNIDPDEMFWTAILPDGYPQLRRTQTDVEGRFSITGVTSVPQYFGALPYNIDKRLPEDFETIIKDFNSRANQLPFHRLKPYIKEFEAYGFGTSHYDYEPDVEILSLQINGITFYPRVDFEEIAFGVLPGTHIKDVVVTVQPRMHVQGRVLFKDGTPLTNDRLTLTYNFGHSGHGGRSARDKLWVDADGYFVHYLDEKDATFSYTFSIEYQGLKATAKPVRLEPGQRYDNLIFRFNSAPIAPK